MKTTLKIIAWSLTTLIIVVLIAIAVLVWWVFTPEKITPVVQNQLNRMLTCETKVDRVELTFFSTFPDFAFHLHGLTMVQAMDGAPSDTLLRASSACATIDISEFIDNDAVVIRELLLNNAFVLAYIDAEGRANYDVMPPSDEVKDTSAFELPFSRLEIEKIELNNSTIGYYDLPMKLQTDIAGVNARMTLNGKKDIFSGKLNLQTSSIRVVYDSVAYLDTISAGISTAYSFDINRFILKLDDAAMVLNDLPLDMSVMIENNTLSGDLMMDIVFASDGKLPVEPVLALIPAEYAGYLEGIKIDGKAAFKGQLKGIVNKTSLPILTMNIDLVKSSFAYQGMPYSLRDMSGNAAISLDLNNEKSWHILVDDFDARTLNSRIKGSGKVDDLMGDIRFDLKANGMLNLADARPVLPDDMKIALKGIAKGNMNLKFRLSHMMNAEYEKLIANGKFDVSNFYASYDTITAATRAAKLSFSLPNNTNKKADFVHLYLKSDRLDIQEGSSSTTGLIGLNMKVATSNLLDSTIAMIMNMEGSADAVEATMDADSFKSGAFQIVAELKQDKQAVGESLKWIPTGYIRLRDGIAKISDIEPDLHIPAMEFDFTSDEFIIRDSRLVIDQSDFKLIGKISNVDAYLAKKGLLKGDFEFISSTTDVNYLMKLVNGLGYDDATNTPPDAPVRDSLQPGGYAANSSLPGTSSARNNNGVLLTERELNAVSSSAVSGPFMVPKGIDITLNVRVNEAFVSTDVLTDVRGTISVKDGLLALESVLFTSSAARMQLNALYHTPRRNHLFLGIDFHLTHIEIEELLLMIPDIDTIMPMLRSFSGRGEFHFAAETYLDSTYRFKPSTLLGVASIEGTDLVLMDGETFTEIAKVLMFNKKTENRIDSLAAEFTIFKSEVDIYPFQIVMDKYKAVVSGKHNLDMNFNYHISLTDSPLPIQLGIDVSGNPDNMKFRPAAPRYKRLYRPDRRREIDVKQLQIKKMIRDTLKK